MNDEEDPECDCEGTGYTGLRCHKAGPSTAAPSTTPDPKCEALEDMCSPGTCYVKTDNTLGCQCPSTHTGEFCETSLSGSIARKIFNYFLGFVLHIYLNIQLHLSQYQFQHQYQYQLVLDQLLDQQ